MQGSCTLTGKSSDVASTKLLMEEDDHVTPGGAPADGRRRYRRRSKRPTNDNVKHSDSDNDNEEEVESDIEEEDVPKRKQIFKAVAPHLGLYLIAIVYSMVGAAIFISLEEPHSKQMQTARFNQIQQHREEFVSTLWNLTLMNKPISDGEREFHNFVAKMHKLHKISKWRADKAASMDEWNFHAAVFFVVSTLTTIGYGNVVPVTRGGRVFLIFYSIIGIPLLIVTTADVAKFMSSGVNKLYINYLKAKEKLLARLKRLCCRRKRDEFDLRDTEGVAEFLWSNINSVHYVKVDATLILAIVVAWATLGGLMLKWYEESWSFFDGFYFSMTSVLKVGFGDMLPSNQNFFWLSLLYIFFGLTIATMCVDVVGLQYVHRIHQIGRVAKHADYLNVIQKAKYRRRRRDAMRSLMGLLTMLNRIQLPAGSKKSVDRVTVEEEEHPPLPPKDVRVVGISPYSMKLTWTPPSSPAKNLRYVVSYRMKHSRSESTINITSILDREYEIKSLKSFSIYEVSVAAMNRLGRSDSVHIIQITEPESAPQDLTVDLIDPSTVRIQWKPPYKKRKDVKMYAIYYSKNLEDPFEKWYKICVDNGQNSLTLEELSDAENYAFCISSVYDKGHSPISRSVYPSCGDLSMRAASRSTDENANSSLSTAAPLSTTLMDVPL